jgi:hypothetical protein
VAVTSDRAFAADAVTRSLHGEAVQVEGGALVP